MEESHRLAEEIETLALLEMHEAGPEQLHHRLGLGLERIGGTVVATSTREPSTLFNRAIGLGVEGPATREEVEEVVGRFSARGIESFYLHLHPESRPPELRTWLRELGLDERCIFVWSGASEEVQPLIA